MRAGPGQSLRSQSGSRARPFAVSRSRSPGPAQPAARRPSGRAPWGTLAALTGPGPFPRRRASPAPPPAAGRAPRPAGLGPPPRAAACPPAAAGAAAPRPATNGRVSSASARQSRRRGARDRHGQGDTHTERGDGTTHTPTALRCHMRRLRCPRLQTDPSPGPCLPHAQAGTERSSSATRVDPQTRPRHPDLTDLRDALDRPLPSSPL